MPLPSGWFIKRVIGGPVSLTDDWSIGLWYHVPGGDPGQTDFDQIISDGLTAFEGSFWTPGSSPWSDMNAAGTKVATSKGYLYDSGVLKRQTTANITPSSGTGSTPHPAYVACCVTLRTAGFTRRERGRVYLPATAAACDTNSGLFTGLTTTALTALAGVIETFGHAGAPFTADPVVVSQTGASYSAITEIKYDNLPDTQHGRNNQTAATSTATEPI